MRVDTTEMPTVEMFSDGTRRAPGAETSEQGEGPVSIVVVDDNAEVRSMLAAILREAGYAVTEADGPENVRDLLDARPFDVAVIDLVMPDINGLDVLSQLRGLKFGAELSAIVMNVFPTGVTRETVLERVAALGRAEVLDKPVTSTTLLAALRRLVPARS